MLKNTFRKRLGREINIGRYLNLVYFVKDPIKRENLVKSVNNGSKAGQIHTTGV